MDRPTGIINTLKSSGLVSNNTLTRPKVVVERCCRLLILSSVQLLSQGQRQTEIEGERPPSHFWSRTDKTPRIYIATNILIAPSLVQGPEILPSISILFCTASPAELEFMAVAIGGPNYHKRILHDQDLIGSIIFRAQNMAKLLHTHVLYLWMNPPATIDIVGTSCNGNRSIYYKFLFL